MPHSRAYAQLANTVVRAKLKISISSLTPLSRAPLLSHMHRDIWGWAQAELQSDHGRITDGSRTDHSRITRFHKLKFKMFFFVIFSFVPLECIRA